MKSGQTMWICQNQKWGYFANRSLASLRKDCIAAMCDSRGGMTWEYIKSFGWKPVKVKVTIEKVEK